MWKLNTFLTDESRKKFQMKLQYFDMNENENKNTIYPNLQVSNNSVQREICNYKHVL